MILGGTCLLDWTERSARATVTDLAAVPEKGLEPSHHKAQEPKSCVSTNSTTPAWGRYRPRAAKALEHSRINSRF